MVVSLWSENSRTWIDELSFRTKMKKSFIINIFIRREKEEIMIVFIYQTKNPLRLLQLKNFYHRSYLTHWHVADILQMNLHEIHPELVKQKTFNFCTRGAADEGQRRHEGVHVVSGGLGVVDISSCWLKLTTAMHDACRCWLRSHELHLFSV